MIIATAGHVDHGKTSLVNALTGVDTDRLEEEKQRGLTIDLGFAYSSAESGERLGFIDVPGHIRFINNMLAGVSAIDHALLVVAADDGVMPQTREHFDILKLLDIRHGTIAITKIDRCDASQVEATIDEVRSITADTFLADAEIIPVSSVTGEGMDTLQIALEIAADECTARQQTGLFRLCIDRRFSIKGAGVVVTGSVFAGSAAVGDEVFLMPQARPVRIRSMHTQNQAAEEAHTGDRCAVNITGPDISLDNIHRGNWLTTNPGEATDRADLRLLVLSTEKKPLRHWTPVHLHTAANHMTGRIALLDVPSIAPGESGLAQLVFEPSVNLCIGDRVVIRDQAAMRTIGGGRILDPLSPKRGRARPERVAMLGQINPADPQTSARQRINDASAGISKSMLAAQFNFTAKELDRLIDELAVLEFDDLLIPEQHFTGCGVTLLALIEQWHEANPGKAGLPQNQLQQLVRHWPAGLIHALVRQLLESGELEQQGNLIRRPGFGVQLSQEESRAWQATLPLLAESPTRPPVLHDLAKAISVEPKRLEKILNQVLKTGQLVRPVKNRYFLPEAIAELKQAMQEAAGDNGQFTVQQYRDATGIGRNLSIEILEYFDRQGVTRRLGDVRQIVERT